MRDIDCGDMTDDGEVELNLHREDDLHQSGPARVGHFRLSRNPVVRVQELQWVWMVPG